MSSLPRNIRIDENLYKLYQCSEQYLSLSEIVNGAIAEYLHVETELQMICKQHEVMFQAVREAQTKLIKERSEKENPKNKYSMDNLSEIQKQLVEWIDKGFAQSEKEQGRKETIPSIESCRKVANKYANYDLSMKKYDFDEVDKGFVEWYLESKTKE